MGALFGRLPPAKASLAQGGQPVPAQNEAAAGRTRMQTWVLLSLHVSLFPLKNPLFPCHVFFHTLKFNSPFACTSRVL